MRKGRGRKHDKTGRSENHQYWNLSYSFGQSDAIRCLSGPALKVLVELRCRYNGFNNGKIILSYEEAARFLGLSKSSVKRAFDELIQVGFIKLKKLGRWYGRKASEWTLTMVHEDGHPATNEWLRWRAPKSPKPTKKINPRYPNGLPSCFDDAA